MNYYEVLGVSPDASPDEIKTAYRALVQLFHTDRLQHASAEIRAFAEERLKAVTQAYAVLSDSVKRAAYNASRQSQTYPPTKPFTSPSNRERQKELLNQLILNAEQQIRDWQAQRIEIQSKIDTAYNLASRKLWKHALITCLSCGAVVGTSFLLFRLPREIVGLPLQLVIFIVLCSLHEIGTAVFIARVNNSLGKEIPLVTIFFITLLPLLGFWSFIGLAWAFWLIVFYTSISATSLLILTFIFVSVHWFMCRAFLNGIKSAAEMRHFRSNLMAEVAINDLKAQVEKYRSTRQAMN